MSTLTHEKLKAFTIHGVRFIGERGNQNYGDCPFCSGAGKFYASQDSQLWDCKKCGKRGNFLQFLEETAKQNVENIDDDFLKKLCIERKLPLAALEPWEIGRNGMNYTFPVRDDRGIIQDLRIYCPGKGGVKATKGCHTGLLGLHMLKKCPNDWPVYLCEGDWDGMAFYWLLRFLKKPGLVLATPGANTFKKEWARFLDNRVVNVLYDNDEAGEAGDLMVKERLTGTAKQVSFLHWSNKLPTGYDIRDIVALEAIKKKKPVKTYKAILSMLRDQPRKKAVASAGVVEQTAQHAEPEKKSLEEVFEVFKRWLFLKNTHAIEMMLAVAISNLVDGDPLWLFLVAPPGGAKTEVLTGLTDSPDVYFTSSLTPHALISGAPWTTGGDPSLIPKLNGKILVIKDFTSIMSKRDVEKDEIFGILRDAYDGKCSKVFGTGVKRSYESKFTIISAVTPEIYKLSNEHQSLGERFLKFTIGSNLVHASEEEIIDRAITNLNRETDMRKEISETVRGYLFHKFKEYDREKLPALSPKLKTSLVALAQIGARMRGTVSRERYRPDLIATKPSAEIGSRLGKQLAKLALSLAIVHSRKEVNESDYVLCKKTMLDTISQRNEDILKCAYLNCPKPESTIRTKEISFRVRYPHATCARILSDMEMLDIVNRTGKANKYEWKLSPYVRGLIQKAELYKTEEEINRPKLITVKAIVRKAI